MKISGFIKSNKESKTIVVEINRDSVCMADDIDDHSDLLTIRDDSTLEDLAKQIMKSKYLPHISGGIATWVLTCNEQPLVVLTQSNRAIYRANKNMRLEELFLNESIKFYLKYCAQKSELEVYSTL